jgi:pimeloyl-ACP methyl ester carboxylesterase
VAGAPSARGAAPAPAVQRPPSPDVVAARRIAVAPGETLHVAQAGAGETVVIVPGPWSGTFAFRHVVPALVAAGARVVVVEPLGVASSGQPRHADYSLEAQGRRIGVALDSLGIRQALFIGQAASTSMLLRLALCDPPRVRGIVSIEGGAVETQGTPGMQRGLAVARVVLRLFPSQAFLRWRLRNHLEAVSGGAEWITRDVVEGYFAPIRERIPATIAAYRAMASAAEPTPLAPRLRGLSMPLLLLLGDAPHVGGPDALEVASLSGGLPHLQVQRVPDVGHLVHEERPDAVVAAVGRLRGAIAARRDAR